MAWDGVEKRRKNGYASKDDFNDLKTQLAVFTATVTAWMASTTDYRMQQKERMDLLDKDVKEALNHIESYKGLSTQVKVIWGFMATIILAIVIEWVRKY